MTLDELVKNAEKDFIDLETPNVVAALAATLPADLAFLVTNGFSAFLIGLVMAAVVKRFDWAGYFIFKRTQNSMQASDYEDAIRANNQALANGDKDAQAKALQDKLNKFAIIAKFTT